MNVIVANTKKNEYKYELKCKLQRCELHDDVKKVIVSFLDDVQLRKNWLFWSKTKD